MCKFIYANCSFMCDRFVSVWSLWQLILFSDYLEGKGSSEMSEAVSVCCCVNCTKFLVSVCVALHTLWGVLQKMEFLAGIFSQSIPWKWYRCYFIKLLVNKVAYKVREGGEFTMQQWSNYIIVTSEVTSLPISLLPFHCPSSPLPSPFLLSFSSP